MDATFAFVFLVVLVLFALGAFVAGMLVGRPERPQRPTEQRTAERRADGRTAWMRIGGGGF
jgi:hypothetical protein